MNRLPWLLLVSTLTGGCGAFADAAGPAEQALLLVDPAYLFQGHTRVFELTYSPAPPWAGSDGGTAYVVRFDIAGSDVRIQSYTYDGRSRVEAVLYAQAEATTGERKITLTTGYERFGQQQQQCPHQAEQDPGDHKGGAQEGISGTDHLHDREGLLPHQDDQPQGVAQDQHDRHAHCGHPGLVSSADAAASAAR